MLDTTLQHNLFKKKVSYLNKKSFSTSGSDCIYAVLNIKKMSPSCYSCHNPVVKREWEKTQNIFVVISDSITIFDKTVLENQLHINRSVPFVVITQSGHFLIHDLSPGL
jgi:hypothetical protein